MPIKKEIDVAYKKYVSEHQNEPNPNPEKIILNREAYSEFQDYCGLGDLDLEATTLCYSHRKGQSRILVTKDNNQKERIHCK